MIRDRLLATGSLTAQLNKLQSPKTHQKYLPMFKPSSHNRQLRMLKELAEDIAFFQTFPSYLKCLQYKEQRCFLHSFYQSSSTFKQHNILLLMWPSNPLWTPGDVCKIIVPPHCSFVITLFFPYSCYFRQK